MIQHKVPQHGKLVDLDVEHGEALPLARTQGHVAVLAFPARHHNLSGGRPRAKELTHEAGTPLGDALRYRYLGDTMFSSSS